jgi:Putative peptidoglycan binding domain
MITMYDSVDLDNIPADATAVAAYTDGRFANFAEAKIKFPEADILSIAVFAADDAMALDIETGDASPESAAAWVTRQLARGVSRPCLYADASTMIQVIGAMNAAGIPRNTLRLWSAHYTSTAHICGPSSCGALPEDADGTQWTDTARGINLDESLLSADFFGSTPPQAVVTYLTQEEMDFMSTLPVLQEGMNDKNFPHWYIHRLQAILAVVYGYKVVSDGAYGPVTTEAVKALQGDLGLVQDGVCGPVTWSKVIAGS